MEGKSQYRNGRCGRRYQDLIDIPRKEDTMGVFVVKYFAESRPPRGALTCGSIIPLFDIVPMNILKL